MRDDEGRSEIVPLKLKSFFMIFNMFFNSSYHVIPQKNFSVSEAIADAPDGVTWSVPWAMTSFRTGKQRFSKWKSG